MGPSVFSRFVSSTEFWFSFYERARVNVRAKGRAVNSVFLVQLRKMLDKYFGGLAWSVKIVEEVVLSRMKGVGSVWERAVGGISRG
jgi:CBS domain containing-hemolysin-like protein